MKTDTTSAFNEHLKRIKVAKDTTDLFSQMQVAEKTMSILWEDLFDQICHKNSDLSYVKDLTMVLNKLIQSYRQLFMLTKQIRPETTEHQHWSFSDNLLKELEEQLQLL
jgi:hypothetical protein